MILDEMAAIYAGSGVMPTFKGRVQVGRIYTHWPIGVGRWGSSQIPIGPSSPESIIAATTQTRLLRRTTFYYNYISQSQRQYI